MQSKNRLLTSIKSKFSGPSRFNVIAAVGIAVIVAIVGYALVVTIASGSFASIEPENGALTGNASVVSDASASGGKAIKFGGTTAPVGTWPSTPPAQVCGNASLLTGPATAPAGAVTVPAGNNASFNFGAANTTYWFAPGVHTLGTGQYNQIGPGNNSTFIGGPGAVLDGQYKNEIAFGGTASGVTIKYLTIQHFNSPSDQGVVNHDSGIGWVFSNNTITLNHGGALFLSTNNTASYNCLKDNGQYGFQAYKGTDDAKNIVLDHNEISGNNTDNLEVGSDGKPTYCGCTGGGKFWSVQSVKVTNNYVHDNKSVGLWADTNDADFVIEGNWIENNDSEAIFYEISYNMAVRNNVIKHNNVTGGVREFASQGDNFPTAAVYISESGGDSRVNHTLTGSATIDISNNLFVDNYSGVTVWENADRYCGSPNNTSTGYCTIVNPSVVTEKTCNSTNIKNEPYYSDCRWKSQNVNIHNNEFHYTQANVAGCSAQYCGHMAILSNYGTSPTWSPYKDDVVQKAITFNQNNKWYANKYYGPWQFMVQNTDNLVNWNAWRAAPYNQDPNSTIQ